MTPAEKAQYKGTTAAVETFTAWRKDTGELITVDDRTFDEALHSLAPVPAPTPKGVAP